MRDVKFLGFDVFGTVVDWRSGVARELAPFLARHGAGALDAHAVADAWRGQYQPSMERIRSGAREWVRLTVLHRENLETVLRAHGVDPQGVPAPELAELSDAWERLDPWPDSVAGLTRLKTAFPIGALSNANFALMMNLSRFGALPWDIVLGAEATRSYKPQPRTYTGAAEILGLRPDQVALVAAHHSDLAAARACGLRTIFIHRPLERGPDRAADLRAAQNWDMEADSFIGLADAIA